MLIQFRQQPKKHQLLLLFIDTSDPGPPGNGPVQKRASISGASTIWKPSLSQERVGCDHHHHKTEVRAPLRRRERDTRGITPTCATIRGAESVLWASERPAYRNGETQIRGQRPTGPRCRFAIAFRFQILYYYYHSPSLYLLQVNKDRINKGYPLVSIVWSCLYRIGVDIAVMNMKILEWERHGKGGLKMMKATWSQKYDACTVFWSQFFLQNLNFFHHIILSYSHKLSTFLSYRSNFNKTSNFDISTKILILMWSGALC